MSVTYNPINWQDGESGGTSLDATNLNIMEQGIVNAVNAVNALEESVTNEISDLKENNSALENQIFNQNAKIGNLDIAISRNSVSIIGLQGRIYALETEVPTLKERVSAIESDYNSGAIINSASGHFLTLTDVSKSKDSPISLTLYGKATQGGTSGKNLLNNTRTTANTTNGITFTPVFDDNGLLLYYEISGTPTVTTNFYLALTPAMSFKAGSYIISGGYSSNISVRVRSESLNVQSDSVGTDVAFTLTEDADDVLFHIRFNGAVGTVSGIKVYPMFRLANISDSTYEPYTNGASPNPDYPQEVTVAGADGDIVLTSCGKNLYDVNDKLSATSSEFNVDANGYITLNSYVNPAQSVAYRLYYTNPSKALLPNTKYKIVVEIPVMSGCTLSLVTNVPTDKNNSQFNANKRFDYAGTYEYEATTLSDFSGSGTMLRTVVNVPVGSTASCKFRIMVMPIEITDNTYERYRATIATIPLTNGFAGIPVASGGNYTDESGQQWVCDTIEFTASTGNGILDSGKYVQRVGYVHLDENSEWTKSASTEVDRYIVTIDSALTPNNLAGFCNIAKVANASGASTVGSFYFDTVANVTRLILNYATAGSTTLDTFKSAISDTGIDVYYVLAEPITTDLTSEQLSAFGNIHTFYPVTNLFTDDIGDVGMGYVADTKAYIDNKFNELATAILSAVGSEG